MNTYETTDTPGHLQSVRARLDSIKERPDNARLHEDRNLQAIIDSLTQFGQVEAILCQKSTREIIGGHGRRRGMLAMGWEEADVTFLDVDDGTALALNIALNRTAELAGWDNTLLGGQLKTLQDAGFNLESLGWTPDESLPLLQLDPAGTLPGDITETEARASLAERFGVPPFSVLDARQGYWQNRKKCWLALGIASEIGRDANLTFSKGAQPPAMYALKNEMREASGIEPEWCAVLAEAKRRGNYVSEGTSIFDPVLCELAYRWFSPEDGLILDPFAGGSVRGLVAARLNRRYLGIDLSESQINANRENWSTFHRHCAENTTAPDWRVGDSSQVLDGFEEKADLVFSCPPYADLERYSDDERDLSTMEYPDFLEIYATIIKKACTKLKDDSFACFVVGDLRDKAGNLRNFVSDTIDCFQKAGVDFYNDAVLVTVAGSLPIRAGTQFEKSRKLGRTHQMVLVFVKGDARRAVERLGSCEWGSLDTTSE